MVMKSPVATEKAFRAPNGECVSEPPQANRVARRGDRIGEQRVVPAESTRSGADGRESGLETRTVRRTLVQGLRARVVPEATEVVATHEEGLYASVRHVHLGAVECRVRRAKLTAFAQHQHAEIVRGRAQLGRLASEP